MIIHLRISRWLSHLGSATLLVAIADVPRQSPSQVDAPVFTRVSENRNARTTSGTESDVRPASAITQVEMRHVDFMVDPEVVLHIHHLRGTMRSKQGETILFDDKRSFILHLASAEVGLTGADLTALLNKYVFAYPGAPLSHLSVTIDKQEIVQTGRLHKVVDLPFTIRATLSVTPDGHIRIHPTYTKIIGLHVDDLMRGLGLTLDKLIDLRQARGASVKGNDIYLMPDSIIPPPTIEGHATAIAIVGNEVVQTFRDDSTVAPLQVPDPSAPNFMLYKGGTLRFGRLVMLDAELQIVDRDTTDPFRFNLDRYNTQLIAGYSRTLPDLGLEVYMPDIDDAERQGRATR